MVAAPVAANCSTLTLTLHPGVNPPLRSPIGVPPSDIPSRTFRVSVPLYPGSAPLRRYVATPYPEVPGNRYLQTASAEYRSTDSVARVRAWFARTLTGCGWSSNGFWTGNATAFTGGDSYLSLGNVQLSLEMSFGTTPSGGTYIGYGVEEITLPERPASSFLRGPFVRLRIAFLVDARHQTRHTTVVRHTTITRLVRAINSIRGFETAIPTCYRPAFSTGPAWLTFIRANGSVVHAFERGPGECNGLALNGARWLIDPGRVWNTITALSGHTSN